MKNKSTTSSRNSQVIAATAQTLYRAFTEPTALSIWLAPGKMTGKVHNFELRVGGGYQMSLFYPLSEAAFRGKTSEKEDRFTSRFIELSPFTRIVQIIQFDSNDPAFTGEMIMDVSFETIDNGTRVTIEFNNIPPGIDPDDNKKGTEETLEKLARYVAGI